MPVDRLTSDSPKLDQFRWPMVRPAGRTKISRSLRTVSPRDVRGPVQAWSNLMLRTSETLASEAGSVRRSNSGRKPTICKPWFRPTARGRLRHRHSSAQQTRVRRSHRFLANQPGGHGASYAPCSTPLVRANIVAFCCLGSLGNIVAGGFYPSPRGNSHSGADHAWVRRSDNGSPLVRRCGKFPTVFQRWRSPPDVRSRSAVCVVEQSSQPTWP